MHRLNITPSAKVLIVGDSIPLGATEVIDKAVTGRVGRCFVEDLRDSFRQVEFIVDAVATRTSDDIGPLIAALLQTHRPHIVLLVIGGSDADVNWRRFIISGGKIVQSMVPRERYDRNLRQIVGTILAAGAVPILTDITNHWLDVRGAYLSKLCGRDVSDMIRREGGQERSDAGLEEYRQIVRQLAAETGTPLVDFTSVLSQHPPQDRVGFDGMHPSELAHRAIAAAITLVLTRVLHDRGFAAVTTAAASIVGRVGAIGS